MIHGHVDEVAQTEAARTQLAPPPFNALDQHGNAAEALQHGRLGSLDPLGKRDLLLPGEQLRIPHLTEVGIDQVARELCLAARSCIVKS